MKKHNIGASIVSLANPWFDFLEGTQAVSVAQELNDELQSICESSQGKLHGFASLPVRNISGIRMYLYIMKEMSCHQNLYLTLIIETNSYFSNTKRDRACSSL